MNMKATIAVLRIIDERTFQTGSVAYGSNSPLDHDRVCSPIAMLELLLELDHAGVMPTKTRGSGGYGGEDLAGKEGQGPEVRRIRFTIAGTHFDVFAVPSADLPLWVATTDMVRVACLTLPSLHSNKPLRVLLFRQVRDLLITARDMGPLAWVTANVQA